MTRLLLPFAAALTLPLAACQQATPTDPAPTESDAATEPAPPASSFTEDAKLQFTGTEPFWGGHVEGTQLTYSTPENIDGASFAVERSSANGVLTLTGSFEGAPFTMQIGEGQCSDGMSDRTYPLTVDLTVNGEARKGCAWSDEHPASGPQNP